MPSLAETKNVDDVRDKDAEKKGKDKEYADAKRNAVESDIAVGDQVLLRQKQDNKLTTPLAPDVYKVIEMPKTIEDARCPRYSGRLNKDGVLY